MLAMIVDLYEKIAASLRIGGKNIIYTCWMLAEPHCRTPFILEVVCEEDVLMVLRLSL
jgi:hypothetical protein